MAVQATAVVKEAVMAVAGMAAATGVDWVVATVMVAAMVVATVMVVVG